MTVKTVQKVTIATPDFTYFPDFPEGFRPGIARLGALVGAASTGMSVYELPTGQAVGPYHYEKPGGGVADSSLRPADAAPSRRRGGARAVGRRFLSPRAW